MNIKEVVRKHLIEAKMSRETEAFLLNKWNGMPLETVKKIFDWFESVKSTFPLEPEKLRGGLLSFLGWFNGSSPNREKFELKDIRDIRKYSLPQIKRLWSEFKTEPLAFGDKEDAPVLSVDPIFYEKINNASPSLDSISNFCRNPNSVSENDQKTLTELFEKSKELWFGTRHLLFENDGLRVYNVPDQATSVAFGWYLYYIRYTYNYSGSNWCTTTPDSNNFFEGKRSDRTFYFVIDESKFPQTTENRNNPQSEGPNFYLSALQVMRPSGYENTKFRVTGIHNPGEPSFDEKNLIKLYPNIGPLLETDKLKYTVWSKSEQLGGVVDPISRINEREGDEYEFAIRPPDQKLEYINRAGAVLRKARSWNSMTEAMKKQYSSGTLTLDNMYDKFSNSELFKAMSQGERRTLDFRISQLSNGQQGIGSIIKNIMQNDFYVDERISLDKDYLSLYRSRSSGKFGIYNLKENNWVNHDGITYDDEYNRINDGKPYKTTDGKRFFAIIYSRTSQPDNTSFYFLLPAGSTNKFDGYFVSAKKWEELKVKLVGETDPEKTNTDFDPETGNDIEEMKKGV